MNDNKKLKINSKKAGIAAIASLHVYSSTLLRMAIYEDAKERAYNNGLKGASKVAELKRKSGQ